MKIKLFFLSILITILLIFSCSENSNKVEPITNEDVEREALTDTMFTITADSETDPIPALFIQDAADDPAIWIHPTNPDESFIIGSNKRGGIVVYDLDGRQIHYSEIGRINNIDVAYNLKLSDRTIDICGGTNRTDQTLDLYEINPTTGELEFILNEKVKSTVNDVYGFCFYNSPLDGTNYAILCGKDGVIEQYKVIEGGEYLELELLRSFDIGTQPEGLVADHKHGYLYIGEENKCIWKYNAEPNSNEYSQIPMTTEQENTNIEYDIEGLTIYYTSSDDGYLLASSQGNNSFAIYKRTGNNDYIGSFKIVEGEFDGNTDTDGIDVLNLNLGASYPNGIFVAQDGVNIDGNEFSPQNFKMVKWEKIANLFEPPLLIDPNFNPREFFD